MKNFKTKRSHWGELLDGSNLKKEIKSSEIISFRQKVEKLKSLPIQKPTISKDKSLIIENALVTQTVEVINQTEMIQTLIDTYTTDSSGMSNCVLNPCQLMPNIDFPPDTTANLLTDEKFNKPIWYIPPNETKFARGVPNNYVPISKPVALDAIRKSACGLLRLKGFNDCTESALIMLMDGVDEFYKSLLETVNNVLINDSKDRNKQLSITTIEKGYFSLTNTSLTSLHNYFKNEIIQRNNTEIKEFKNIFQEYDKLMQESHNLQKSNIKDEDYLSLLDFTTVPSSSIHHDGKSVNIMSFLDGENASAGFKEIFEGNVVDTSTVEGNLNLSVVPSSMES